MKQSAQVPSIPLRARGAQGTIEYLVIIAIVVVIALIVVGLLLNLSSPSTQVSATGSKINASAQSVAVLQALAGSDGNGILTIKNNTGDGITIDSILVNTIDQNSGSTSFSITDTKTIQLKKMPNCTLGTTQNYTIKINYTSSTGLAKTQTIDSMTINCETTAIATNPANTPSTPVTPPVTFSDTTPPSITNLSPANATILQITSPATLDLNFTVTDSNKTRDCNLLINNIYNQTRNIDSNNYTGTFTSITFTGYTLHTWTIKCRDYNNNASQTDANLTLLQPPQLRFQYFSTNTDFNNGTFNQTILGSIKPLGELDWNASVRGKEMDSTSQFWNSNLGAVWHFNETSGSTSYDSKGTNNATNYGSPTPVLGRLGGALTFAANGKYVAVPYSSYIDFGGNDFTISAWIKPASLTDAGGFAAIMDRLGGGALSTFTWNFYQYNAQIGFRYYDTSHNNNDNQKTGSVLKLNEWQHVLATRNGTTLKMYVNGVEGYTGTIGTINSNATYGMYIGNHMNGTSANVYYNGSLDEPMIFSRGLSATEVQQLYAAQKGTWQDTNLVAYYKFNEKNGTTIYDSARGNSLTLTGTANNNVQGLWDTNSLSLDGSGYATGFNYASGKPMKTITFWMYVNGTPSNYAGILSDGYNGIRAWHASNQMNVYLYGSSCSGGNCFSSANMVLLNQWMHVGIVMDETNLYYYRNGQLFSQTGTGSYLNKTPLSSSADGNWTIGRNEADNVNFNGKLEDFKIYDRTLTAAEIQADYNRGLFDSNYVSKIIDTNLTSTPNVTTFNSIKFNTNNGIDKNGHLYGTQIEPIIEKDLNAGLVALWHFNGNANDSSGNDKNGTWGGSSSYATGLWGTQAAEFAQTQLTIPPAGISSSTLSVNMWFKIYSSQSAANPIAFFFGNSSSGNALYIHLTTANGTSPYKQVAIGNWANYNDASAPNVWDYDKWNMLTVIRTPSSVKAYINGNLVATQTSISTIDPQTFYLSGFGVNHKINGELEDAAVWNKTLSDAEIKELFNKGAARLGVSYRACTQSNCSDTPTWTPATDYNYTNNDFNLSGITNKQYFQWAIRPTLYQFPDGSYMSNAMAKLTDVNLIYTN